MKKKIAVLTATRAEYGLLSPVIHRLMNNNEFDVRVVVTGAHLSPEFGLTYRDIVEDGVEIDRKIEILLSSDTPVSISKSMGLAMISFAEYFEESKPDILLVLGDRYETLAVCCAAMNAGIPIVHLYGGETTEGAVDEAIRHAITKMSYLHLTSTEKYRKRVIQLGEDPSRVFNVGAMGIENAKRKKFMTIESLEESMKLDLHCPYAIVTFHPVTLDDGSAGEQCEELLSALDCYPDMHFIFTKANADKDGRIINQMIEQYACVHKNASVFDSLGMQRYLSVLQYAEMVIGNSSSGLIEVPSFGIPTINIGDRQKGRLKAESVIDCMPKKDDIERAINKAKESNFRQRCSKVINPYGDGDTSRKVVDIIQKLLIQESIDLKKKFYDIQQDEII